MGGRLRGRLMWGEVNGGRLSGEVNVGGEVKGEVNVGGRLRGTPRTRGQNTVNVRPVHILLECILVTN